jgi:hypothetical protein
MLCELLMPPVVGQRLLMQKYVQRQIHSHWRHFEEYPQYAIFSHQHLGAGRPWPLERA